MGGSNLDILFFCGQNTTGDGLLTALQLLKIIRETREPLSELVKQMTVYPQVLVNVKVKIRKTGKKTRLLLLLFPRERDCWGLMAVFWSDPLVPNLY